MTSRHVTFIVAISILFPFTIQVAAVELVGYAVLPPDTAPEGFFADPIQDEDVRIDEPLFENQPVQGFSALQRSGLAGTYWALTDNGAGSRATRESYLLRLYQLSPNPRVPGKTVARGSVRVGSHFTLRDPRGKFPFEMLNGNTEDRAFTGADVDVESFVFDDDESIWIGDEYGPFLLHFDAAGRLLESPHPLPELAGRENQFVRSAENPEITTPRSDAINLPESGGLEGLAADPNRTALRGILETAVDGDPAGLRRIYEFNLTTNEFSERILYYRLNDPSFVVVAMAGINSGEFLVLECDSVTGDPATFNRLFVIDVSAPSPNGVVPKREVANLEQITDPNDLAGKAPRFRSAHWTVESVLPLTSEIVMLVNDSNNPRKGSRVGGTEVPNEFIWIRLNEPLNFAWGRNPIWPPP